MAIGDLLGDLVLELGAQRCDVNGAGVLELRWCRQVQEFAEALVGGDVGAQVTLGGGLRQGELIVLLGL